MQQQFIIEPPLYFAADHVWDIHFHPHKNLLAASLITGQIQMYPKNYQPLLQLKLGEQYQNTQLSQRFLQKCQIFFFWQNPCILFQRQKNMHIQLKWLNYKNNKRSSLVFFYNRQAINRIQFITENLFITGDDNGIVKFWNCYQKYPIFQYSQQQEAITGLIYHQNFILATSLDGSLAVYDVKNGRNGEKDLYALSDCMEQQLYGLTMIKNNQFVAVNTSKGNILLFKWDWFGDYKDRIKGHPSSIGCMLKIDENTLITGSQDGFIRGISIYPNKIIDILGQHQQDQSYPAWRLSQSYCKKIICSCSSDNSLKFYQINKFLNSRQKQMDNKIISLPTYIKQKQAQFFSQL